MARKRLFPLGAGWSEADETPAAAPRPPIAHVAGDAAAQSALDEMAEALTRARETGRMVIELPLSAVDAGHQSRDRMDADPEALAELKDSIRARGQQAPVEVVETAPGRYGLISGWRRLRALSELAEEAGAQGSGTVLALVRRPADAAEALVAMVEENEIRADLSFYERARIVRQSLLDGVFDSDKQALQSLFSSVSYARRSKIKSFLPVVDGLGGALRFPTRISERLGLQLSQALTSDPGAADRLRAALTAAAPETPEAEAGVLARALRSGPASAGPDSPEADGTGALPPAPSAGSAPAEPMSEPFLIAPGIRFAARKGRVELEGEAVNAGLIARLQDWLRSQG